MCFFISKKLIFQYIKAKVLLFKDNVQLNKDLNAIQMHRLIEISKKHNEIEETSLNL